MSSDEVVLRIQHISKRFEIYDKPRYRLQQMLFGRWKTYFREFWALRDIDFEVKKGECVGIIGRNGAGKSTLLQIVTGTLQPTEGTVERHGRLAALLELGSGFNPEFTGRENVYMNAAILGLTKAETDAKYNDIVAFAEIGEFIDRPVKTYSSGMMVRLAFAVNAFVDPDVLIVDEALAVGDAMFQQKCMRFIRKFKEEHTILFVSHDTAAVVNLCDRAVLLDGGQVKMIGSPKEVSEQYLKDIYSETQVVEGNRHEQDSQPERQEGEYYDMRRTLINGSKYRNDMEVFKFSRESCFGAGGAEIENVFFADLEGNPLSWIVGGEIVRLTITVLALKEMNAPIIGYTIKDHLGQWILGDNTFITTQGAPVRCGAGQRLVAEFEFYMPTLCPGNYSIDCAVADGTQENHVQQQWIHDAVIFVSHSSYTFSLFGAVMKKIDLRIVQ